MNYAQIKNMIVKNIILINDESLVSTFAQGFDHIIQIDEIEPRPGLGWSYDGENFSAPLAEPEIIVNVTPRQFRQALVLQGVSVQQILDAINTLPEPNRSLVEIDFEYSTLFIRTNPLVNQVGQMLGWTSEQLDNLWIFAATL